MQKRNTGVIAGLVMGLGLALALATVLSAPSAQAQNTSFLQKRPISRLGDDDRKLFDAALRTLLASDDEKAEGSWENPASGSRGTLKTLKVEKASPDYGVECRTLQVHNEVKGVAGDSRTRLCKSRDGEWRLAPQSKKK